MYSKIIIQGENTMAYNKDNGRDNDNDKYDRNGRGGRNNRTRRKVCQFCVDRAEYIDFKDISKLKKFMTERSKILPRRVTGCCSYHQRELTISIKRARQVALIPYVSD
jgi:small subunit ribosomal protein S18